MILRFANTSISFYPGYTVYRDKPRVDIRHLKPDGKPITRSFEFGPADRYTPPELMLEECTVRVQPDKITVTDLEITISIDKRGVAEITASG